MRRGPGVREDGDGNTGQRKFSKQSVVAATRRSERGVIHVSLSRPDCPVSAQVPGPTPVT